MLLHFEHDLCCFRSCEEPAVRGHAAVCPASLHPAATQDLTTRISRLQRRVSFLTLSSRINAFSKLNFPVVLALVNRL